LQTELGRAQAKAAGEKLLQHIEEEEAEEMGWHASSSSSMYGSRDGAYNRHRQRDKLVFLTSPYLRCRQTFQGIR
jgi:broad specificity phosphatase PhoE